MIQYDVDGLIISLCFIATSTRPIGTEMHDACKQLYLRLTAIINIEMYWIARLCDAIKQLFEVRVIRSNDE